MKIFLDTIGCRLNQGEIERYARQFHDSGHKLVDDPFEADLIVVNTCAVTSSASSDSRQKLHKFSGLKDRQIYATGCLTATTEAVSLGQLPGVVIIPNADKDNLVERVLGIKPGFTTEGRVRVPGHRQRTRAFIKAQDGCDNFCTFCITRVARGKARSQPAQMIIEDIQAALMSGVREVILAGVNLGSWGGDLVPPQTITDLLRVVLDIPGDHRIRLSSIEPWGLPDGFYQLWLEDKRLCRHFHLPLQSGCAATLRRMVRNTTPGLYREMVKHIRELMPDAVITTDVIVGFPGETQAEFEESLDFIRSMDFHAGHVFHYSLREGTAAAQLPDQVDEYTKKERSRIMREAFEISGRNLREKMLGSQVDVLWEGLRPAADGLWKVSGLTSNAHRVHTITGVDVSNRVMAVKLTGLTEDGFTGEICRQ